MTEFKSPRSDTDMTVPQSKHGEFTNFSTCSSCQARVMWVITPAGRKMPVDPGTDFSHFATCPNADSHRRRY